MALNINGVELDFDFACPEDFARYAAAFKQIQEVWTSVGNMDDSFNDPYSFHARMKAAESTCQLFPEFLDRAFGKGAAIKLLGEYPTLTTLVEILIILAEERDKATAACLANALKRWAE